MPPAVPFVMGGGSGTLRLALTPDLAAQVNDLVAMWTFTVGGALA